MQNELGNQGSLMLVQSMPVIILHSMLIDNNTIKLPITLSK